MNDIKQITQDMRCYARCSADKPDGRRIERWAYQLDALADQIERLTALQRAAHQAGLLHGVTGFDETTRKQKLAEHMDVIAEAMCEALDEINRVSRQSEGKIDADPWFSVLHEQALIAAASVEREACKAATANVWSAAFRRPLAAQEKKS